jgi:hypothetical protein
MHERRSRGDQQVIEDVQCWKELTEEKGEEKVGEILCSESVRYQVIGAARERLMLQRGKEGSRILVTARKT